MPASSFIFLRHHEVDKQRWDACINSAANSLIYGYSFYLDAMAPRWNALVEKDYNWVLPLPHRQKFGITYLYQPAFTQQLGVFARRPQEVPTNDILKALQERYRFCEMRWNYATTHLQETISQAPATNYILDLKDSYANISERYSKDLRRNLQRGAKFPFKYIPLEDYHICIHLYQQYYGNRMPHVKANDYKAFEQVCKYAAANGMLVCRQVVNENDEVLALALLLSDGKRLYNMMNTTTTAGRKTEANHILLDCIIREFCQRPMLFDFEGSDLPGVKAFYQNFSPVDQPYYAIRYNRLPWPVRMLKK